VIALVLLGLACLLCSSTYRYFGNTWDEPEHLAAGLQLLDRGLYTYDIQHPPLARLAMAIGPYLAGARAPPDESTSGEQPGRDILYQSQQYDRLLTLARLGVLPFLAVMVAATWLWAARWFGRPQAILASFLVMSTPAILGHAGIAALDVPGTSLCILAMYLFARWLDGKTLRHALLFGFVSGLAMGTKLYALPFLAIAVTVLAVTKWLFPFRGPALEYIRVSDAGSAAHETNPASAPEAIGVPKRRRTPSRAAVIRSSRDLFMAATAAVVALVLAYGGRFETMHGDGSTLPKALDYAVGAKGPLHRAAAAAMAHVPVPLALDKFLLGIKAVENHNSAGHQSYLMGEVRSTGWWYFYPVVLALKTPIPLLLLGTAGLAFLLVTGFRKRRWPLLAPSLCCLALLAFCCTYSHINIGVRHVLFVYPFLAIAAAHLMVTLYRQRRSVTVHGMLLTALLWQSWILYSSYPDYLAYFNAFAGGHPEQFVVDSDLDWGQDLRRLERVLQEREVPVVWLAYRGTAALWLEKLPPYFILQPGQEKTGWIAISLLAKQESPAGYGWLQNHVPVQRVGKSIDLYYIPEDIPDEALHRPASAK
jgi:hypothetical protein